MLSNIGIEVEDPAANVVVHHQFKIILQHFVAQVEQGLLIGCRGNSEIVIPDDLADVSWVPKPHIISVQVLDSPV